MTFLNASSAEAVMPSLPASRRGTPVEPPGGQSPRFNGLETQKAGFLIGFAVGEPVEDGFAAPHEDSNKMKDFSERSASVNGQRSTTQSPVGNADLPSPTGIVGLRERTLSVSAIARSSGHGAVCPAALEHGRTPRTVVEDEEVSSTSERSERSESAYFWIGFGTLRSVENPGTRYPLALQNDGRATRRLLVGSRKSHCNIVISGPGVGEYHCGLTLDLENDNNGQVQRKVTVHKIKTRISRFAVVTTVRRSSDVHDIEDDMPLESGMTLRFGGGDHYQYVGPELLDLYSIQDTIYDHCNSLVRHVSRKSDERTIVAKTIPAIHRGMAEKEIAAYKALGSHPQLVQFFEAFPDSDSGGNHLIFEAGYKNLFQLAGDCRGVHQEWLTANARIWIKQIAEGIEHIHKHNMVHRDLKPENILVMIGEEGDVNMKVMDLGLARLGTESVPDAWRVGTRTYKAPASFRMGWKNDRVADSYGIGRILYFLLTTAAWPEEESSDPDRICACASECKKACIKRSRALEIVAPIAGATCLDFLKTTLVAFPEQCMAVSEILSHGYLVGDL
ncbi:hypothetical protein FRB90_004411 [Tulasnella sp. 427]|nr:hypothetical protein FRB90_004411 [Tulasnella sp. 427]